MAAEGNEVTKKSQPYSDNTNPNVARRLRDGEAARHNLRRFYFRSRGGRSWVRRVVTGGAPQAPEVPAGPGGGVMGSPCFQPDGATAALISTSDLPLPQKPTSAGQGQGEGSL